MKDWLRIRERIQIAKDHFYSHRELAETLRRTDDKMLFLLNNLLDIHALRPATGMLRLKQEAGFQMLRLISALAKQERISFWLAYGTLLGAVRHKGFVPWDDDVDIGTLLADYELLYKTLNSKLPDRFMVAKWKDDNGADVSIMRVVDKISRCHVDIYPFEQFPGALNCDGAKTKWEKAYLDKFASVSQRAYLLGLSDTLKHDIDIWRESHKTGDGDVNGIAVSMYFTSAFRRVVCRESDVFPLGTAVFEGCAFPVPCNPDAVLSLVYGDYEQFPRDVGHSLHEHANSSDMSLIQMRKTVDVLCALARSFESSSSIIA